MSDRKFKLKLNLAIFTFRVKSRKLLGFVISQKGNGFLGRLNYIAKFISHLTTTCEPLLRLLHKDQVVEWNKDCQTTFKEIKQYLQKPIILVPRILGRHIMIVFDESMHDEYGRKEHTIYYLSKFFDCEFRYSLLKQTCWLVSKMNPIKYIFEKSTLIGRINQYDVIYVSQEAIKGSAKMVNEERWSLLFDETSNALGCGVEAILMSPKNQYILLIESRHLSSQNVDICYRNLGISRVKSQNP
ncbi:hypothetical protein CR513_08189, partial [Mucuna pruriens]